MLKRGLFLFIFLAISSMQSQEALLPTDFRQHNLTEYNSSFLSPVFALDRNNPQSIALWSRWQWQSVDGDPTTLFLNYTRRLNTESVGGVGFFQNNTGIFLQSGGTLNYAYALELKSNAQIAFGLNLFGFVRKLADDRFQPDPDIGLPSFAETSDFVLRLAPSLRFKLDGFSIGIAAENLIDYNFTTKEKETGPTEKVYIGLASYNIPIAVFGSSEASFLQPTIYMKTVPGQDNQFGFTTLFSTPKFWVQTGLNSFYGLSGGIGGRFFRKFSFGALMEFGTSKELKGTDPSFEILTAYNFGAGDSKRKVIGIDEEEEELPQIITEAQTEKDARAEDKAGADKKELRRLERETRIVQKQERKDAIAALKKEKAFSERLKQQRTLDSIESVKRESALNESRKLAVQKVKDSVAAAQKEKDFVDGRRAALQRSRDSIATVKEREKVAYAERLQQQKTRDSLTAMRKAEEAGELAAQKRRDSLAELRERERLEAVQQAQRPGVREEQEKPAEAARVEKQKSQDSLAELRKAGETRVLAMQERRDSLAELRKLERLEAVSRAEQRRVQDSIALAQERQQLAEAARVKRQKTRDSLAAVRKAIETRELFAQRRRDSLAEVRKLERLEEVRRAQEQSVQDSIAAVEEREQLAEAVRVKQQKNRDSLVAARKTEETKELLAQKRRESLAEIRERERREAIRLERQRLQDSIAAETTPEETAKEKDTIIKTEQDKGIVKPKEGEKYEEAVREDGLLPGFYLIANVFSTKKYRDKFVATLKDQGFKPGTFYRPSNKYSYVYLQRYDSIGGARKARDSKLDGKYEGKTWIFRAVAN